MRIFFLQLGILFILLWSQYLPLTASPIDSICPSSDEPLIEFVEDGLLASDEVALFREGKPLEPLGKRAYCLETITFDDLKEMLGVTEFQAFSFIDFRRRRPKGSFALYHLKEIPGWDRGTIDRVLPFFYDETTLKPRQKNRTRKEKLRYHTSFFGNYPIENRDFKSPPLGPPYKLQLRSSLQTSYFSLGILADKDPYEPLFKNPIKGFDRYSFYFATEQPLPYFQKLIVGDYSLSLGQGLILRQRFLKGTYGASIETGSQLTSLNPCLRSSGYNHMRGVATLLGDRSWKILIAYSQKKIDAKVDNHKREISLLREDAPHRTKEELLLRNRATERMFAGRIALLYEPMQLGLNALYVDWMGYKLEKALPGYRQNPFAHSLSSYYNFSIDSYYRHPSGRMDCGLEMATNRTWAIAGVATFTLRTLNRGSLFFSARYLAPYYFAPQANSHFRRTRAGDEWGIFVRYVTPSIENIKAEVYTDYYKSLLFRNSLGDRLQVIESLGKVTFVPSSQWEWVASISWKKKIYKDQSLRIYLKGKWSPSKKISLGIRTQYKGYWDKILQKGYYLSGEFTYLPTTQSRFSTTLAYYYTDSFKSRLFIYFPQIRYSGDYSFYSGQGFLWSSYLSFKIKNWKIEATCRGHRVLEEVKRSKVKAPFWRFLFALALQYNFVG